MADRSTSVRGFGPAGIGYMQQSTNAERLLHHAVALCASSNRRNLEEQFETLARDCLTLPEEERLQILLTAIEKIGRNKDDIVQGKALPSLEVMIGSLSGEARAEGLRSFCGSFDKFAKELPWAGIVKQSMTWAKEFDPKTNAVLCGKIASVLDHFRPGVRLDVVEALLDQAHAFFEADRVELMRVFAQNIEHLFKKSTSSAYEDLYEFKTGVLIEKTFCNLVKQCAALKPENAAMILVILCNRLEKFESGKRIEMYMLLAKQLSALPPPQQIHLINGRGWGLSSNLTWLPDAARVAAYKAIADVVVLLPEKERQSMVADLLDRQEVWRKVPSGPEREGITKRLRDSIQSGS